MTASRLVLRGLTHFWRTNLAVVAGVATAVAVLSGALLVGDSVRGSLHDLVVRRVGATDLAVVSSSFFRADLADRLRAAPAFSEYFRGVVPDIAVEGLVANPGSGSRADGVRVYGVDDRFWAFHGQNRNGPADRDALVSPALAARLSVEKGTAITVRVQQQSSVPLESLQGRKGDLGRTLNLTISEIVPADTLGEFSLAPVQGDVFAVFVPFATIQRALDLGGRANLLLVSATGDARTQPLEAIVRATASLDDLHLTVRTLADPPAIAIESDSGVLTDDQAARAVRALSDSGLHSRPILTYLANSMRIGDREIPYSLVSAVPLEQAGWLEPSPASGRNDKAPESPAAPSIVLNTWAAEDLQARRGDRVTLEYFVWKEPGRLETASSTFHVRDIVPIAAGDRDMAPPFPGVTNSPSLSDWDPPFPVDLKRVRPKDEAYWDAYRTTPKAFIELEAGQRLWRSRYGALTSVRGVLTPVGGNVAPASPGTLDEVRAQVERRLRASIDPIATGLAVSNVRGDSVSASSGATDFGEYFTYFSFFLVVSALVLASLFFKLGVEQRVREVGLLRALGFTPRDVRRLFLSEGVALGVLGAVAGAVGAVAYAALLMYGLRTWWFDAVGTTSLSLHVTSASLGIGALAGILAAIVCIWWTLRGFGRVSERSLLSGQLDSDDADAGPRRSRILTAGGAALVVLALALLTAAAASFIDLAGGFFGAGTALLCGVLCLFAAALRRRGRAAVAGAGWPALARVGVRNVTYRPGRSVMAVAVIAAATFLLISVDAFRRGTTTRLDDPHSGTGGASLLVETLTPVVHDPNGPQGRESMNLFDLESAVTFSPFRLRPGDDASCLNLYAPKDPRILAPTDAFLDEGRFTFQSSLAATDAERANPWLLLRRTFADGAIPVIADANSMTYVLHRALGEDLVLAGQPTPLRFVGALRDSVLQGELLMSDANFRRAFPSQAGYRVFLVNTQPGQAEAIARTISDRMKDDGVLVTSTAARLAEFHRVENTYLSTFQTLGGLGLLLGTVGLATVVLRNALERRHELALLRACGYERRDFLVMGLAENVALLAAGLAAGALCAMVAVVPAVSERGGRLPLTSGGALIVIAVLVGGLLSSVLATRAALRGPLLETLRSE